MTDLSDKRKNYEAGFLTESDLKQNPLELFRDWYLQAEAHPMVSEANAMSVSTVENGTIPRTRMVLLKQYTWEGFIFYTNYTGRKGRAIEANPNVCLHFFWAVLEKQIIINGTAEKIVPNLSDGYFHSRPRGSQLGAIISPQSQVIPDRDFLDQSLAQWEEKTKNWDEIPRPDYWGGYLVRPFQMEFWQGRPNRLHDRFLYTLQEDFDWKIERLAP